MSETASLPPLPDHVELFNEQGSAPLLILCDHAGNRVPPGLGELGLGREALERHIGWDIGAADAARRLGTLLDAPVLLDHCSRLVIDPNRRPLTPTSIPAVSDGCVVPGNRNLDEAEVLRRVRRYFLPYHRAVARAIGRFRRRGRVPAILSVHSFTPSMHGQDRPWQVGILWRHDRRIADPLLAALKARGDIVVGSNQPYSGLDEFGFTVEFHCQRGRLPHVMIELRQDEIATAETATAWAGLLAEALRPILADDRLYTSWTGPLADRQPWRVPTGLMHLR
ncbi:N-formylglutamate amidohydrolase [Geminicoccaceae bacterium 1502E]|nr:N-formylglutamate amidohydrolase [Geminicoccaceae bacterium 1502E]